MYPLRSLRRSRLLDWPLSSKILRPTSSFSTSSPHPKPAPPPIFVAPTDYAAGRGVFASRTIRAGDLIHTAHPIVSHPSLSSINTVCYFCLTKLTNPSTPAGFCTHHCQQQSQKFYDVEKKADWSKFNEYCRLQGLKYPLLVKRLACQVISGVSPPDVLDILQPEIIYADKIAKSGSRLECIYIQYLSGKMIGAFLLDKIAGHLIMSLKVVMTFIEKEYGFTVKYHKVWHGIQAARDTLFETWETLNMLPI